MASKARSCGAKPPMPSRITAALWLLLSLVLWTSLLEKKAIFSNFEINLMEKKLNLSHDWLKSSAILMLVKYNFVHLNKVAKRLEQKFMLVEYNEFSVKRNADVYKLFRARGYYLNHISSICSSVRRLSNNCIRQKCNQYEH